MTGWPRALEGDAQDIVAAYRGIGAEQFVSVRREVRRRAASVIVGAGPG
jgi:hypothetical protein